MLRQFQKIKAYYWLVILLILLGLFATLKVFSKKPESKSETKHVHVISVQKGPIQQMETFIGTIRSNHQTTLVAKTNGTLVMVAKSGQSMKKGELIVTIENDDLEKNFRLLKECEDIAKAQFERALELLKTGVSNKSMVEEKKAALLDAQKKLSDGKIALEEIKIYAPFDGVVGMFKVRDGGHVQAGDIITAFYNPVSLRVDFDLPLATAMNVSQNTQIIVHGKKYPLTFIQKMLDEETRMCPAYANIESNDRIIGTTVDVTVIVQERPYVTIIPYDAVFLKKGVPSVYIVEKNKVVLKKVKLGVQNQNHVEVIEGLEEGNALIAEGHTFLHVDDEVEVVL